MKVIFDSRTLDAAAARMRGLADGKINSAARAAINVAARAGYEATRNEMTSVFDRVTPWVLGGVEYKKATAQKLEAQIDFDKWGNKALVTVESVLLAEIFGGTRKSKRHEIALQRVGILPPGMQIVPGEGADIDKYGNMSSSQIVQIIAFFRAFGEQGYKANMTEKTRARLAKGTKSKQAIEYFVVKPDSYRTWGRGSGKAMGRRKMQPGIYKRIFFGVGSAIKPVMIFIKPASYRKRLDFYTTAERAAREKFNEAFPVYLNQMLTERGI